MTPEEVLIMLLRGQTFDKGTRDSAGNYHGNGAAQLADSHWLAGKREDLIRGFETGEYKVVSTRG